MASRVADVRTFVDSAKTPEIRPSAVISPAPKPTVTGQVDPGADLLYSF